jgi:branched-chain amino acid transport system ATP-binding protein
MALLELADVHAHYGSAPVLQGLNLAVDAGEVVSIFGRNGAGKTTTLKTIMGWLKPSAGRITLDGDAIGGAAPDRIFRRGIGFIPEDRRVFATLTVEENLTLGLFSAWRTGGRERARRLDRIYALFPRLAERRRQLGKTLSGGEQQMLAIGRALVGEPKLLLVDEPSEGLAPKIVHEIFAVIARMREERIALLLVEQNVQRAAAISTSCYVMEKGRIIAHGPPSMVMNNDAVRQRLSV